MGSATVKNLHKAFTRQHIENQSNRHFARFAREEDGVVTAFALFMVLMMCLVGGIGVDLMRNEMERTQVQGTLDRAVLAAADLDQPLAPDAVVRDYFLKSGLSDYLSAGSVTINGNGNTARTVSGVARGTTKNMFMSVMGRSTLPVYASATANEAISNIEVSLVLDISGSMATGTRFADMKEASKQFVNIMLDPVQADSVTLSVVPYNGTVNAGSVLADYFPFGDQPFGGNCVRFEDEDFNVTGLERFALIERLASFDNRSGGTDSTPGQMTCPLDDTNAIIPWSNDPVLLTDHINSLELSAWTSIDLGMKWATLLLDPTSKDKLSDMVTDGFVQPQFLGRPSTYDTSDPSAETLQKVVVIMTDGRNTRQYDLKPEFKTGKSDIFVALDPGNIMDPATNKYSVYDATTDQFYWLEDKTWNPLPFGAAGSSDFLTDGSVHWVDNTEVFHRYPINYIEQVFFRDTEFLAVAGDAAAEAISNADYESTTQDQARINLDNICTEAKDQGIIVFAVAFEAPDFGQEAMAACASSSVHYFDAQGAELSNTFTAIARTISQLRLTN